MRSIKEKLNILSIIAKKFNENNIVWAVGGSTLLYLKGLTDFFADIDIEVKEDDVLLAKKLLNELGILKENKPNKDFKTKYFLEFVVDGVDIDLMAGFTIVNNGKEYYFPLKEDDIYKIIKINEEKIPLHSVLKWKEYYKLMNREDKVKLLTKSEI